MATTPETLSSEVASRYADTWLCGDGHHTCLLAAINGGRGGGGRRKSPLNPPLNSHFQGNGLRAVRVRLRYFYSP